jgi:hypothetical protein
MNFMDIETQRKLQKISIARLCAASGVDNSTYFRIRSGEQLGRPDTQAKLASGLSAVRRGEKGSNSEKQFRIMCGLLAYQMDIDVGRILRHDPQLKATSDPKWMEIQKLRDIAIYAMCTVLGTPGKEVARVARISEAAVSFALNRVETRRDEPVLDRMFSSLEQAVQG